MMKLLVFSLFALLSFAVAEKARYDNYRVYEILIDNDQQLELMQEIENYPDGVRRFNIVKIVINENIDFVSVSFLVISWTSRQTR